MAAQGRRVVLAEVTLSRAGNPVGGLGDLGSPLGPRDQTGKMLPSGRLLSSLVPGLLLAAQMAAAFEPISVGLAIGAASILTGYLSKGLYCRFSECCHEERPLNSSGTAGGPQTVLRVRRGGRGGRALPRTAALQAAPSGQSLQTVGLCPSSLLSVRTSWDFSKKTLKAAGPCQPH